MRTEHTIDNFEQSYATRSEDTGSRRYWAPCLAVALVAVSLFYVTLQDLVRESAARAPALPPAVMPAYVEPPRLAEGNATALPATAPTVQVPQRAAVTLATFKPLATVAVEPQPKAAPAVVEVRKCITSDGEAAYTDGACPEGASASTLQIPRDTRSTANL